MSSIGYKIPTTSPSERYADEAAQVILRALGGQEGDFRRHERGTSLSDIVNHHSNDNS